MFDKAKMAFDIWGHTEAGHCHVCKREAVSGENLHTDLGRKEFLISGICETCFDRMYGEDDGTY